MSGSDEHIYDVLPTQMPQAEMTKHTIEVFRLSCDYMMRHDIRPDDASRILLAAAALVLGAAQEVKADEARKAEQ